MRLVRAAWGDLKHHRLRNALSALTMFVGVLSLVLVSAASAVAGDLLLAKEEQANGRAITWQASVTLDAANPTSSATTLGERLDLLSGHHGEVVVTIGGEVAWSSDGRQGSLPLEWIHGDLTKIRRLPVVSGQLPSSEHRFPPLVVMNEQAAAETGCAVGCILRLREGVDSQSVSFTVAAIIADGSTEPYGYAPIAAMGLINNHETSATVMITTQQADIARVQRIVEDALIDAQLTATAEVMRMDTTEQVAGEIELLRSIFSAVSAVMLTIAALGILNVGLASVEERRRELVVRRAVGARKTDLFLLVMGSSILTGVIVAATAIVTALAVVYVVIPSLIPVTTGVAAPAFPWGACLVGLIAAVATSALGSCFPAWRASRLPVAHALRD